MKFDDSQIFSKPPRRRWLGAIAAALAGFAAWRLRGGRRGTLDSVAAQSDRRPPWPAKSSTNTRVVLRPSPESVKRHG
jgi:hypothetical protein